LREIGQKQRGFLGSSKPDRKFLQVLMAEGEELASNLIQKPPGASSSKFKTPFGGVRWGSMEGWAGLPLQGSLAIVGLARQEEAQHFPCPALADRCRSRRGCLQSKRDRRHRCPS